MSEASRVMRPGEATEKELGRSPELRSLALLIRETDGNVIAFALYRTWKNRQEAIGALKEHLGMPVAEFSLSAQVKDPLVFLAAVPREERRGIFLYGLEEALPEVAGYLNRQREAFADIPHAVVFWVTQKGLQDIAKKAPDFWAWRSGVFDLRTPEAATTIAARASLLAEETSFADRDELERKISLYQELLREYGGEEPADEEFLLRVKNRLTMALYHAGRFQEAETQAREAADLSQRILGPEDPQAATTLTNLGGVLQELGDLEGARGCYERARAIDEKVYGREHPAVARDVNNLGLVLQDLGDLAGARGCFERALAIDERVYGPEHPTVASMVNNLGMVLQNLGDLAGARECYERARAIGEKVYGPEHPTVATMVNNLGMVLQDLGDLPGAKGCYERARAIDERAYGREHPEVARDVNNLGGVLQDLGDLEGAKGCYERARAIDEKVYGPEHPAVARDVNNLGNVMRELGDREGARGHLERAWRICKKFLGEEHPTTRLVKENWELAGGGGGEGGSL